MDKLITDDVNNSNDQSRQVRRELEPIPPYDPEKENWVNIDGIQRTWLRMIYGTKNPITDINFFRISTNKKDPKKISIPE